MTQRQRIFLAHPSNFETELPQFKARALAIVHSVAPQATLVTGAEDYAVNFVPCGGWEGWCRSVGAGVEFVGTWTLPRFNAFIVGPNLRVGKATADIVRHALSCRPAKLVLYFNGMEDAQAVFVPVVGLLDLDPHDYTHGWELLPQPNG